MQRFKNNVSDGWLFKQELRLFRNFMRNLSELEKESSLKKGTSRRVGF